MVMPKEGWPGHTRTVGVDPSTEQGMTKGKGETEQGLAWDKAKSGREDGKEGRPAAAGHVATARGRKKNASPLRLRGTGRRSRPDLSQHLPAPAAFSPFDACLLSSLRLFRFTFRPSQW